MDLHRPDLKENCPLNDPQTRIREKPKAVGQLPEEGASIRQRRTKYNLGYGAQKSIARSKKVTGQDARLALPAIEHGGVTSFTQSGSSATADGSPSTSRLLAQPFNVTCTVLAWSVKKL